MIEVNLTSKMVFKMKNLPGPKFAHGACLVKSKIVIAGGISDMMLNMGLRMVPPGDQDCHSFDIYSKRWYQLPDLPIGKLHPTLITINSRFVFHIGGFDDFDFDIYRLDMNHPDKPWKVLKLDLEKQIVQDSTYLETKNYYETLSEQEANRKRNMDGSEEPGPRDSDDDSDDGKP